MELFGTAPELSTKRVISYRVALYIRESISAFGRL